MEDADRWAGKGNNMPRANDKRSIAKDRYSHDGECVWEEMGEKLDI